MSKRFTAQRRNNLAQFIINKGNVSVGEAAERFQVSTETIRKDLIFLEKKGIIKKSHGGATTISSIMEKNIVKKSTEHADIKNKLALKALEFIPYKGVIFLDAGTTTLALAKLLKLEKELTVFTNSATVLETLADSGNQVFVLGGRIRPSSMATVGKWTNEQLLAIHVDVAFLGSDGFQTFNGPASNSFEEAELKKNALKICSKGIVLADSSKCEHTSSFQFAEWSDIDVFITDSGISKENQTKLKDITQLVIS